MPTPGNSLVPSQKLCLNRGMKIHRFQGKVLLAIDYGVKIMGTSLYHMGLDPFPLLFRNISRTSDHQVIDEIGCITRDEEIDHIVLGLPLCLDGQSSSMTERVKRFGKNLEAKLGMDIFYQDETLTSVEAENRMKNSPRYNFCVDPNRIHCVAASVILEDFVSFHSTPQGNVRDNNAMHI